MTTSLTLERLVAGRRMAQSMAARLAALALTAMLAACVMPVSAGDSASPAGRGAVTPANPQFGVFTGEFVDGMPVYRLPPITVIGSRSADLAGKERALPVARSRQVGENGTVKLYPTAADTGRALGTQ